MVFIFKCIKCNSRKFFSNFYEEDGIKYCESCKLILDDEKKEKEARKKLHLEKKKKRRKKSSNIADLKLKKELEQERFGAKKNRFIKEKKIKKTFEIKEIKKKDNKKQEKRFLSDKELQEFSDNYGVFLYVHVTVKRLKATEWRKGKKKVILNKEREIRRTHKGGWSQEKFQRFVDFQKKHALDWINDILVREGVLRPPYNKIVVESNDKSLKVGVEDILREINF